MNEGRQASKRIQRALSTDSDSGSTAGTGSESTAALLWKVLGELKDLKEASSKQQELIKKLEQEVSATKEELERVTEQLEIVTRSAASPLSYIRTSLTRRRVTSLVVLENWTPVFIFANCAFKKTPSNSYSQSFHYTPPWPYDPFPTSPYAQPSL